MNLYARLRSGPAGLVLGAILIGCGSANPSTVSPSVAAPSVAPPVAPSVAASATPSVAPASQPAPSTATASGGTGSLPTTGRIAVADKGYAITLPSGWTRLDLSQDAIGDLLDASASSLPQEMQDMLKSQVGQMASTGVSVFAFRQPEGAIAAGTTLNVLTLPAMPVPLDTFESLIVTQLKGVVGQDTKITTARVQGPAGEFLRLTYDLKMGAASIGTVQYLFLGTANQYVISCGAPGGVASVQAECESVATSLEIL